MARAALRHGTSVWVSWLSHWPTCMRAISRKDPIEFDSRFRVIFVFNPLYQNLKQTDGFS
jgi:hypothetical protein